MIRLPLLLIALLALGACRSETALVSQATPTASFAANNGDTRAAKPLFGAIQTPSSQPSEALGFYSRGCQAGAVALPETGPTWQAMRLSRNRNWGQPILLDYIQDLSQFAATQPGWAGLYVGDMSQPRGGPMLTGHASHQSGLDVDIWMLPPSRLNLTRAEREEISSISTQPPRGLMSTAAGPRSTRRSSGRRRLTRAWTGFSSLPGPRLRCATAPPATGAG
jgi:penicillin-insensitive murein DD-endopeptidase